MRSLIVPRKTVAIVLGALLIAAAWPGRATATGVQVPGTSPGQISGSDSEQRELEDAGQSVTMDRGFDYDDPEVLHLVKNWDFSEDDALTVANFQLLTADLASDILAKMPDSVGGVELLIGGRDKGVDEGELVLEIGVVPGAIGDVTPLRDAFEELSTDALKLAVARTGSTRYHSADADAKAAGIRHFHTRVVEVPLSDTELNAAVDAAMSRVPSDMLIIADADWRTGTVELIETGLPASSTDERWRGRDDSDCHTSESANQQGGDFKGGRPFYSDIAAENGVCSLARKCTIGFPVTINNTRGYMTASHCFLDQWGRSSNMKLTSWSSYDSSIRYAYDPTKRYAWGAPYWGAIPNATFDAGVVIRRWSGTTGNPQIWKYDQQLWRNIEAFEQTWRSQGYDVCHPAGKHVDNTPKNTTYCAEVVDTQVDRNGYDYGSQNFTEVYYPGSSTTSIDHSPGGGSSGGPWFYGSTVYGIHRGTTWHGPEYGVYMRAGEIHNIFQDRLGTDADFLCYDSGTDWGQRCNPS